MNQSRTYIALAALLLVPVTFMPAADAACSPAPTCRYHITTTEHPDDVPPGATCTVTIWFGYQPWFALCVDPEDIPDERDEIIDQDGYLIREDKLDCPVYTAEGCQGYNR